MHVSPLAMMAHFLDVVIQYQELAENSNFSAVGIVIVVTLELVRAVQEAQQLELVANQIQFEYHTTFPIVFCLFETIHRKEMNYHLIHIKSLARE